MDEAASAGRPARLDTQQHEQLREALLAGPQVSGFGTELWTLKRVSLLVQRRFGVRYSDVHIWRLLGQLGFSSQKPERQAKERDALAVARWRRRT